jgi:uncharacterized damage-inducible protein DinB
MSGRSPALDGISFATLLAYRDGEAERWREWLGRHLAALDVPVGAGRTATVGGLIVHIFAVELRYAERLLGRRVTTYEELEPAGIDEIFAIGARARGLIDEFLARADDREMREVLEFQTLTAGTVRATRYKIAANLVNHGVRHWAQIATALRQHEFADQWAHDFLLSDVDV